MVAEHVMASEASEVMTIDELGAYLKISTSTLYKLAQEGGLPGQKIGKRWRFHKGAIDDWLWQRPDNSGNASSTQKARS